MSLHWGARTLPESQEPHRNPSAAEADIIIFTKTKLMIANLWDEYPFQDILIIILKTINLSSGSRGHLSRFENSLA